MKSTKQVSEVKKGDKVFINGTPVHVTFIRKSRYAGFFTIQGSPDGTIGLATRAYDLRWNDELILVN